VDRAALRQTLGPHAKPVLPVLVALVDDHRRLHDTIPTRTHRRAKVRAARAVGAASGRLQRALERAAQRGVLDGVADFAGHRTLRAWLHDLDRLARRAAAAHPRGRPHETGRLWLTTQIVALFHEHRIAATTGRMGRMARALAIALPAAGESAPADPLRLIVQAIACLQRLSR